MIKEAIEKIIKDYLKNHLTIIANSCGNSIHICVTLDGLVITSTSVVYDE